MAGSYITYSLKTGGAIKISMDRYLSMTDADFHNLDTGNVSSYSKSPLITEDMYEYDIELASDSVLDEDVFLVDDIIDDYDILEEYLEDE
jgi:hypoxanthine-guanine phosphoribosyltransferase